MAEMQYCTVHEDVLAAFPELREPYQRLFNDWDNFGGQPPGQYIVFNDTFGTMLEVALASHETTAGREEVLRRACEFGEEMLSASDVAVNDLGIDALADRLDNRRGGLAVAEQLGGPSLRAWFSAYSSRDWDRPADDEIIDLWAVREAVSHLFSDTPTHQLPGISYPYASPDLGSLDAARADEHGAVLLSAYGTTHLCAVIRAVEVGAAPRTLDELALQLAAIVDGDPPKRSPSATYRRIPRGERVWNMHWDAERHCRFWDQAWVADPLVPRRELILAALRGEPQTLPPPA